jgi:hypothetical protein
MLQKHPHSSGHYHGTLQVIDPTIMRDSIAAIMQQITVNRDFDIPYLAGYSKDGKTIYIDRHLPPTMPFYHAMNNTASPTNSTIHVDPFLVVHESVEKALIDELNIHYQMAHEIALNAEHAAVLSMGLSWAAYDAFMQKYIKRAASEKLIKVPKDLDLKPYVDEHDNRILNKIRSAQ